MLQFDLIVEGPIGGPKGDFKELSPHALHLTHLNWEGESPPNVITLEQGTVLVLVGRYATEGKIYRYHVATSATLIHGRLTPEKTNAL